MQKTMTRCLILNCSKAKIRTTSKVHAINLYDGPSFRVLRLFLRKAQASLLDVDIYIISAKHGLISKDVSISNYDEHITPQRAGQINAQVLEELDMILQKGYSEVFALVSKEYLRAFQGYEKLLLPNLKWSISSASEGRRLKILKSWLYNGEDSDGKLTKPVRVTGSSVLKGHKVESSPRDIISLAMKALDEGRGSPYNLREWFVAVGDKHVSPKWLVSLLSGLDVSEFQAGDARRVLTQLGILVEHV